MNPSDSSTTLPMLRDGLQTSTRSAGALVADLRTCLHFTTGAEPALGILLLELIEGAAGLHNKVNNLGTAYATGGVDPRENDRAQLFTINDPYTIKGGAVWIFAKLDPEDGKVLCSAPLNSDGVSFYRSELAEAYATDLLPQEEIDALKRSLLPVPSEDGPAGRTATQRHDDRMEQARKLLALMDAPAFLLGLRASKTSHSYGMKALERLQDLLPKPEQVNGSLNATGFHEEIKDALNDVSTAWGFLSDAWETLEQAAGPLRASFEQDAKGKPLALSEQSVLLRLRDLVLSENAAAAKDNPVGYAVYQADLLKECPEATPMKLVKLAVLGLINVHDDPNEGRGEAVLPSVSLTRAGMNVVQQFDHEALPSAVAA